eukprot:TRINITY_DN2459_c0_g1_i1.p1 TRINITY_DN2459_c0_g1~~TRINITY_DN2459_c0_g1_i1.p1  ORF type:complete len:2012 (+),score=290.45 TRINITY_DN2459_c0_g1_i1:52-6087(+)
MGASESSEVDQGIHEIAEANLKFVPGPKGGRKELGKGGMGVVYLAYWNGSPVAVKKVIDALVSDDSPNSSKYRDEFIAEMEMLSQLRHPHILRLLGGSIADNILVTEFASRGDLFSMVQAKNPAIQWEKRGKYMARDISHAVAAMHSKRIIHRDLKSPNILVCSDFEIKVADVGIAKRIDVGADRLKLTEDQRQYSLLWAAPEMLESDELDEKADVYSLGVIIWELLTQKSPWSHVSGPFLVSESIKRGEHNPIPEDAPEVVRDMLQRCWKREPSERPTAAEVALILSTYCSLRINSVDAESEEDYSTVPETIREIISDARSILRDPPTKYAGFDSSQFISQVIAIIHSTRHAGYNPPRDLIADICTFFLEASESFQAKGRLDLANHVSLHAIELAKHYQLVEAEAQFLLLHGRLLNDTVPDAPLEYHSFKSRERLGFDQLSSSVAKLQEARDKFVSAGASSDVISGVEKSIDQSESLFIHDLIGAWVIRRCQEEFGSVAGCVNSFDRVCSCLLASDRGDLSWNFIYDCIHAWKEDSRSARTLRILPSLAQTIKSLRGIPPSTVAPPLWRKFRDRLSQVYKDVLEEMNKEPKQMPTHMALLCNRMKNWLRSILDECVAFVGLPSELFCLFLIGPLGRGYWFPDQPCSIGALIKDPTIAAEVWNPERNAPTAQVEQFRCLFWLFETILKTSAEPLRSTVEKKSWFRHQQVLRGTPSMVAHSLSDPKLINESILWDLSGPRVYLYGSDDEILFDQLADAVFDQLMTQPTLPSSSSLSEAPSGAETAADSLERSLSIRHIVRVMQYYDQFYAPSAGDDYVGRPKDSNPPAYVYRRILHPLVDAISCISRFNFVVPKTPWAGLISLGARLAVVEARFGLVCEWSLSTATYICLKRYLSPSIEERRSSLSEDETQDLFRAEWGALRPLYRGLEITLLEKDYPEDPILKDLASVLESWEKGLWKNRASIDWACQAVQSFIQTRAWSCDTPRRYRDLYVKLPELLRAQMLAFIHSMPPRLQPANVAHVIAYLESVPLDDGIRPSTRSSEQSWLKSVQTLLSIPKMDHEPNALVRTDPQMSIQVMLPALDAKVFDKKGQLQGTAERGRHAVHAVLHDGVFVHLKAYPEWPGMEYAVGRLSELIIGRGGAPHSRVWAAKSATEPRARWCPIGVSETIHGPTLQDMLKTSQSIPNLDRRSFSQQALMAMLVNPEDGKSDNFVLTTHTDENGRVLSRLVSIDNDHAFVPPVARKMLRPSVQVKTIVFCFNEMMLPVHSDVVEEFLLLKPEKVLRCWLRDLQRYNQDMDALFTPEERESCLNDPDESKRSCLAALLRPDTVPHLFQKLRRMHDLLRANPKISHIDLLKNVEPHLAPFYLEVLRMRTSPAERFRQLAEKEYGGTMVAGAGITKTTTTRTLESVLGALPSVEEIRQPARFGIDSAIAMLDDIDQKQNNIDAVREAIIQKGDCKPLRSLPFEEMKQDALDGINIADLTPENQKLLLKGLAGLELTSLVIPNCVIAELRYLTPIFESSKRLTVLDLSGCQLVNNTVLEVVSKNCPQLAKLFLRDIKNLTAIVMSNVIGRSALDFWNLRRLFIDGCERLEEILVVAPALMELTCKGCPKLRIQDLFGVVRHSDISRIVTPEGYSIRMTTAQVKIFQDRPDRPGLIRIFAVPDGKSVVCVHCNGMLTWFDVNTGQQTMEKDLGRPIRDCSASGKLLCVATDLKFATSSVSTKSSSQIPREVAQLEVIDIATGEVVRTINAYATRVSCESALLGCEIQPLGLQLRDCQTGQLLQRVAFVGDAENQAETDATSAADAVTAFCLHGDRIYVALQRKVNNTKTHVIKAWSLIEEDVAEEVVPDPPELPVVRMQPIGLDGAAFVTTSSDGSMTLWERPPSRSEKMQPHRIRVPQFETFKKVPSMAISEDSPNFGSCLSTLGDMVIYASFDDGIIRCWRSRSSFRSNQPPEFLLLGHSAPVVAMSSCGQNVVVSGTADGAIRFWRITEPRVDTKRKRKGFDIETV